MKYKTLNEALTEQAPDLCRMVPYIVQNNLTGKLICANLVNQDKLTDNNLGFQIVEHEKASGSATKGLLNFITYDDAKRFAELNNISDPSIEQRPNSTFARYIRIDNDYEVPCYLGEGQINNLLSRITVYDKKLSKIQYNRVSELKHLSSQIPTISDNGLDDKKQKLLSKVVQDRYGKFQKYLQILDEKFLDKLANINNILKQSKAHSTEFKSFLEIAEYKNYNTYDMRIQTDKNGEYFALYFKIGMESPKSEQLIKNLLANKLSLAMNSIKINSKVHELQIRLYSTGQFNMYISPYTYVDVQLDGYTNNKRYQNSQPLWTIFQKDRNLTKTATDMSEKRFHEIVQSNITANLGSLEDDIRIWMSRDSIYLQLFKYKYSATLYIEQGKNMGKIDLVTSTGDFDTYLIEVESLDKIEDKIFEQFQKKDAPLLEAVFNVVKKSRDDLFESTLMQPSERIKLKNIIQ